MKQRIFVRRGEGEKEKEGKEGGREVQRGSRGKEKKGER